MGVVMAMRWIAKSSASACCQRWCKDEAELTENNEDWLLWAFAQVVLLKQFCIRKEPWINRAGAPDEFM